LPWSAFVTSGRSCTALAPGSTAEPGAVEVDRALVRESLRRVVDEPDVREAIHVASPTLDARLDDWLGGSGEADSDSVEPPLVRYFARMCARCTPFGLFAGCSLGKTGERTTIELAPRSQNRRHTRIDNDYLVSLVEALGRDTDIRERLRWTPNTSLYRVAGRLHYAETHGTGRSRAHRLIAVQPTPHLDAILEVAARGASLDELARAVTELDPEVTLDEAKAYVRELVDEQLLVGDLQVPMVGCDPMAGVFRRVAEVGGAAAEGPLRRAVEALAAIDASGIGNARSRYADVADALSPLPGERQANRLFQVDMIKPVATAELGQDVIAEVLRGVDLLHRLTEAGGALDDFRARFFERYENREVPLVEALDEETGIGVSAWRPPHAEASPLLAGLVFPQQMMSSTLWTGRSAWLFARWEQALRSGAREIEIAPEEARALSAHQPPPALPDAFQVIASIAAKSAADLARGDFKILMQNCVGGSGASLLGRFCHADPNLERQVREIVQAEDSLRPDTIAAEIAHLPYGRVGNVIARPLVRDHVIEYLGASEALPEGKIPIGDLLLSVRDGRLVLRSRRLRREIVPCLTNSHNYASGLPIYRFLCLFQHERRSPGAGFYWGPLERAEFLPRVVSGRVVLSLARWWISPARLAPLQTGAASSRVRAVCELRQSLGLPRMVVVSDGDNTLPVDLENPLSVDSMLDLVRSRRELTLTELFPGTEDLFVESAEGPYRHEVVIPFLRREPSLAPPSGAAQPRREVQRVASAERHFPPGSEWLYAKLYTGWAGADRVVREVVAPTARLSLASGAADRFFFIRYGDPGWHVRVRFHGAPARLLAEVLPALERFSRPLLGDGTIHRLALDTYAREIERYGGAAGMELAETFFDVDSKAALDLLAALGGDSSGSARWRLVHLGMHMLLADFGLDTGQRLALLRRIRDNFAAELRMNQGTERLLGNKYRQERAKLEAALAGTPPTEEAIAAGLPALEARSAGLRALAPRLQAAAASGELEAPLDAILTSYLHMFANRMFRGSARPQEFVLYDFLARAYEGQLARDRRAGGTGRNRS
jgi:thiopeptide-type bacteriocin biosynthesis protein